MRKDAANSQSKHDFGIDIIPSLIGEHNVYAYPFRDSATGGRAYWRDVGTLHAFWQANMELLGPLPELNLYDKNWPILTDQQQLPPAKFVAGEGNNPTVVDSMTSGGCILIGARVHHSLLFSDVRVNPQAVVEDSVLMPDVEIGRGAHIRKAIIDRGCIIPDNMTIGIDHDQDREKFRVTDQGVVLVTPTMLGQTRSHYVK